MSISRTMTKTVTITATDEVWHKLDRFFALMHYNAGHSAVFGLTFDGDGADSFRIEPPPPQALRLPAQRIGDAGPTLEIANAFSYVSRHVKAVPFWTIRSVDPELIKCDGGDGPGSERVVRRYEDRKDESADA